MLDNSASEIWQLRVDRFCRDCAETPVVWERDRLREAARLLPLEGNPASVEALIAQGAFESAALAIIGQATPFMLSRSGDGHCLATIAGHDAEVTARGASPALALLGAWAAALLARASSSGRKHDERMIVTPLRFH